MMRDIFNSFFGSVHSFGPDVLGKTVDACGEHLDSLHDDGSFSVNNECDVSNSIVTET
ncbi:hypothetical protein Hanom_Chr12g01132031 [Helianthus anomalus]